MQKVIKKIGVILILLGIMVVPLWAVPITELIDQAPKHNQQTVTIVGEAIGELLERGDKAWLNINDGTGAIGVYIEKEEALKIKKWGSYRNTGDKVSVTGKFHKTFNAQGGDMAIEGVSLKVVEKGNENVYSIRKVKFIMIYILVPLACVLGGIKLKNIKKVRRIKKQIL